MVNKYKKGDWVLWISNLATFDPKNKKRQTWKVSKIISVSKGYVRFREFLLTPRIENKYIIATSDVKSNLVKRKIAHNKNNLK